MEALPNDGLPLPPPTPYISTAQTQGGARQNRFATVSLDMLE